MLTIHFLVSGRVQGVFFRASTKHIADEFGVSGWVRNLPDGRVEGIASGEANRIKQFKDWLNHGPDMAEVTLLDVTEVKYREFHQFEVR